VAAVSLVAAVAAAVMKDLAGMERLRHARSRMPPTKTPDGSQSILAAPTTAVLVGMEVQEIAETHPQKSRGPGS
jgi:hypothetical protein